METTATLPELNIFNGRIKKSKEVEKYHNFILSLLSALIIGCFVFLWNANGALSRMQEHENNTDKKIDDMQVKMNNIQLDIFEIKERLVGIETKNNINPLNK